MTRKLGGKKPTNLGKSIVNHNKRSHRQQYERTSHYHSVNDEGLRSIVDRNELDEYLHEAMLAQDEFLVEHQNVLVVDMDNKATIPSSSASASASSRSSNANSSKQQSSNRASMYDIMDDGEEEDDEDEEDDSDEDDADDSDDMPSSSSSSTSAVSSMPKFDEIRIPRRPVWSASMTGMELDKAERESFLEWRRKVARVEEELHRNNASYRFLDITPFEKNIEVWRQLWRVVERCDMIVQIVDARNPLLYYCEDLVRYAHEVNPYKIFLLVVNKADYLTPYARQQWAEYFEQREIQHVFFSAHKEQERINLEAKQRKYDIDTEVERSDNDDVEQRVSVSSSSATTYHQNHFSAILSSNQLFDYIREQYKNFQATQPASPSSSASTAIHPPPTTQHPHQRIQVGMVGYPNVGKSSTINALVGEKKVSVAATPGKTKHFQTINVADDITLCDCPGLVFPSVSSSRAELVVNGVLPIDQMKSYENITEPVQVVCDRISRQQWIEVYSLEFPSDMDRIPATLLLNAHARMRGYIKDHGRPDESRSARIVLKDYTSGKLLYCHPPPALADEQLIIWNRSYTYADHSEHVHPDSRRYNSESDADTVRYPKQPIKQHSNNIADVDSEEDENHAVDAHVDADSMPVDKSIVDTETIADRGLRKVKVNKSVVQQAIDEESDPMMLSKLTVADDESQSKGPLTEKQLRRQLLSMKRNKTGKKHKLRKKAIAQDNVSVHVAGNSDSPMRRMAFSDQPIIR